MAISGTGVTSSSGIQGNPFIITNDNSSKNAHLPNETTAPTTKVAKLEHKVREPERTVYMVPELVQHALLSGRKFVDPEYISIYDGNEVNIYDVKNVNI